jgi:K+/H+ antiporter YhaU regulatory subunit KhtT
LFTGVCRRTGGSSLSWRAYITYRKNKNSKKEKVYLGSHESTEEAAKAVKKKATELEKKGYIIGENYGKQRCEKVNKLIPILKI